MARIRTIKPEFWGDEKLAPLPPIDRLVFLGLIGMADDAGRVVDTIRAIDGFIFPETEDSARESIDKLVDLGRIDRGVTASGQRILQIVNWDHQKIDKPNMAAALPPVVILDESSKRRRNLPAKLRDAILDRDGHVCQLCGVAVRRSKRDKYDADPDLAEIDHIVAVKDGGTNDPQNLQALCLGCNRKKAGADVRRRNVEASEMNRRQVDDVSTPHINDLGSVSPTDDQRPTSVEQQRAPDVSTTDNVAIVVEASLRSLIGDGWPDVSRFLDSRKAATRDAWVREMAKLIGSASQYVPADLAAACRDALALDEPLSGPSALRAFVFRARNERHTSTPRSQSSPTLERAAREKELRDERSRRSNEDAYRAARSTAIAAWSAKTPGRVDEISSSVRAKLSVSRNAGQWLEVAIAEAIAAQCASEAGFPDLEKWHLARRGAA